MALKILLAGESWTSLGLHLKGFSLYTTGAYEEGGKPLISALERSGHQVDYMPNHLVPERFPITQERLSDYDVVILSDIGADTFLLHPDTLLRSQRRPSALKTIADYVASGGGLLMIGGFMSFSGFGGNACYHNTVLADVLPVRMLGHDDRVECPEGVNPSIAAAHPVTADLPRDWPHFLGYQRLIAKEGSEVLLTVGADPFLTLGQHGRGRTAAFASDCSPHWGSPEFTGWDHYAAFWSSLAGWLSGR
ncbi:glutamine amidotransferase [Rhizobium sp. FKL33]|uniref:glutamine amidotransferase n=1 Tax=Rhizobium sp. FKL33 TaxID=2562307 RepID=UPI00198260B3|nr:glutamine amidotransferase [Rhizobium sp. FKL33]